MPEANRVGAGEPVEVPADLVIAGRIVAPFGVRGWVKVLSHTQPPDNLLRYDPWFLTRSGQWARISPAEGRMHGKALVARLDGVGDRDAAEQVVGCEIGIRRGQFAALPQGEYYWSDLIGLRVLTEDGADLGVVDHLIETASNDVLVVRGERERLLPYDRDQVVREVDLAARVMRVAWDPEF